MKYDPVENPSHFGVVPKPRSRCSECFSPGGVSSSEPAAGLPSLALKLSGATDERAADSQRWEVRKYKYFPTVL